jgi:hypothetical protein
MKRRLSHSTSMSALGEELLIHMPASREARREQGPFACDTSYGSDYHQVHDGDL